MIKHKWNTTMENVSVMFPLSISDVPHPGLCNLDTNDHIYCIWRQIIREFIMAQLVPIVDKKRLKMKAIFESDLLTPSSTSDLKGCQEKLPEFV